MEVENPSFEAVALTLSAPALRLKADKTEKSCTIPLVPCDQLEN